MFFVSSCKKKNTNEIVDAFSLSQGSSVIVVNEGNFQWSNASVTYYNKSDNSVKDNIFTLVNDRPLGDVAQSILIINNLAYIVVNNSQKIEVVSLPDFKTVNTIKGFVSPRYILPVNSQKAYVTDLYANKIYVLDLTNNVISGEIICNGSTEEMVLKDDKVYITNTRTKYLYLIDINSDNIVDSVNIGYAASSIRLDNNNNIWVMCAGNRDISEHAGIYKINTITKGVDKSYDLGISLNIWDKLELNNEKDTIYYMNNGIYKMPVSSTNLPSSPFIACNGKLFHGIGIDPQTGIIYIADAIDYVRKGKIYRYSRNGSIINSFDAGVIPSGFCFY